MESTEKGSGPQTWNDIIDGFKEGLGDDLKYFQQFICDYQELSPKKAFENLHEASVNKKTMTFAEEWHKEVTDLQMKSMKEVLDQVKVDPKSKKGEIMMGFYRDYFQTKDPQLAFETARTKIQTDPDLSKDTDFHHALNVEYKAIKPKEKKGMNQVSIQEDHGLFFKLNSRGKQKYLHTLNEEEINSLMKRFFSKFHDNLGKTEDPHFNHEVLTIREDKKIPLALQLATSDTQKLLKDIRASLKEVEYYSSTLRRHHSEGIKFSKSDKDRKILADKYLEKTRKGVGEGRHAFGTEKMNILRELVIDLSSNVPVNTAFDSARGKCSKFGDENLMKILNKNESSVIGNNSINSHSELLLDGYKLYIKEDISGYKSDVLREAVNLNKGVKFNGLDSFHRELQIKSEDLSIVMAQIDFSSEMLKEAKMSHTVSKTPGKGPILDDLYEKFGIDPKQAKEAAIADPITQEQDVQKQKGFTKSYPN